MKNLALLLAVISLSLPLTACTGDDSSTSASGDADGGATGDAAANGNDGGSSDGSNGIVDSGTFTPGAPITDLTPGSWKWVDIAGAKCRDGSATGIGVLPSATGSTKLMVFLEGGGACFNSTTCNSNPATFGAAQFAGISGSEGQAGIFSRVDSANAVKDWNMVYVPYCTGDVHGGSAPDVTVPAVLGKQQFVGYDNVTLDLQRIVPTFPGTTQVLLTGQSAGGFGAALNYVQTTRAFGSTPVTLIDDSGPLFANPTLAACLESAMIDLWGMSKTVIADCGSDCSDPGNSLSQYWKHLPKTYSNVPFAFLDSVGDSVIAGFFGFGANDCSSYTAITPAAYEAALLDMRTQVAANSNAGMFLFSGTSHTSLVQAYTTRTAPSAGGGTVTLESWVAAIVAGNVSNVGP